MSKQIDRRTFLGGVLSLGAAGVVPKALASATPSSFAKPQASAERSSASDKTLVMITMFGGNDGLNTVIPVADSAYQAARSNIAIDSSTVLPIGSGYGLNPSLKGLHAMWQAGQLAIIRGVGYPDPSLSHFQSMDIWQSGSTRGDVGTGWLGRWLDRSGHDALRACSIGPTVLPALAGEKRKAAALQDSTYAGAQLPEGNAHLLALYRELQHPAGGESFLASRIAQAGTDMLEVSHTVAKAMVLENPPTYPSSAGDLGNQLGIVSQLIRAGLPTSAYSVSVGGFDTHSAELTTQNDLLRQVDVALTTFLSSIAQTARGRNTTVVMYSEFGRRVDSNGSGGTDHGTANNVYVLGPLVHGGLYGDAPSLTKLDGNGNLIHTVDFRSVYATVLQGVLGFEPNAILGGRYPTLGFV